MLQSKFKFFKYLLVTCMVVAVVSCDEDTQDLGEFTGNETTYPLFSGSGYDIEGHITFKERKDNSIQAEVALSNTQAGGIHPLHLHRDPIGADGDLVALLNPIDGKTGKSLTIFNVLGDESSFTYTNLLNFNGSIKVHLDDGLNKDEVLSGGNIGVNRMADTNIISCSDFSIEL